MKKLFISGLITIITAIFLSGCCFLPHAVQRRKMMMGKKQCLTKSADGHTKISGIVLAPLVKSAVYVYREGDDRHGPPFATSDYTGQAGDFEIGVPPGIYYVVARKRLKGNKWGPLKPGDLRSETFGPFTVKKGKTLQINFTCEVKTDDDALYDVPGTVKTETSFSGLIQDVEGKPVPSVRIHIYQHIQMSERPKFVSTATGPDGKYTVYLPKGGTYYVCARDSFGGPPKMGDLYGRYDKGAINPSALVIDNGEKLTGINITVQRVW